MFTKRGWMIACFVRGFFETTVWGLGRDGWMDYWYIGERDSQRK